MSDFSDQQLFEFLATQHADDVPLGTSHLVNKHLLNSAKFREQVINDAEIAQRANDLLRRIDSSIEIVLDQIKQIRRRRRNVLLGYIVAMIAVCCGIAWLTRAEVEDSEEAGIPKLDPNVNPILAESPPIPDKPNRLLIEAVDAKSGLQSRDSVNADRNPVDPTRVGSTPEVDPANRNGNSGLAMPEIAEHPLLIEDDREAYNFRSELVSNLEADAIGEVCVQISTVDLGNQFGFLENLQDAQLFQRFSVFIEHLISEQPAIQRKMIAEYSAIGRLRFQGAVADQDFASIQNIGVQFAGTEASNTARKWLGDRALVAGNLVAARKFYRSLDVSQNVDDSRDRMQLANALAGTLKDGESSTTGAFGLNADEFSQLLLEIHGQRLNPQEFHQRNRELPRISVHTSNVESAGQLPAKLMLERIASIEVGPFPSARLREIPSRDWIGRGLGLVVAGDVLLSGSDTRLGQLRLDRSKSSVADLGSIRGIRPDMLGTAFWPLKLNGRIIGRAVLGGPPSLHGVDEASLKLLWTSERNAASDGFVVDNRLFVITSETHRPLPVGGDADRKRDARWVRRPRQPINRILTLSLEELDPLNGRSITKHAIAQFDDRWNGVLTCGVAIQDDLIVTTVGATVICVDLSGDVQWIRRQPWIRDSASRLAVHDRPVIFDQTVLAYQPDGGCIECLELSSGVLKWSAEIAEIEHVVGVVNGWLIVKASNDLHGIEATAGQDRWALPLINLTEFHAQSDAGHLVVVFLERINADQWRPVFAWVDAKTGTPVAEQPIDAWVPSGRRRSVPSVGPVVQGEQQFYVGYSSDDRHQNRQREIWRLRVGSDVMSPIPIDSPLHKLQIRRTQGTKLTQPDVGSDK